MKTRAWIAGALLFAAMGANAAVDIAAMKAANAGEVAILVALVTQDGLSIDDAVARAQAADPANADAYAAAKTAASASVAAVTGRGGKPASRSSGSDGSSGGGGGNAVDEAVDQVLSSTNN